MIILTYEQRSPEWKESRLEKITGTRLGEAIGTPARQEALINELIAEALTGEPKEFFASKAMNDGAEAEAYAVKEYEQHTGEITEEVGFCIADDRHWLANSPDRLIKREGKYRKAVEIKAPNSDTAVKYIRAGEIPREYEGQVLSYFLVNPDLEELDFGIYDPRIKHAKYRLTIFNVKREDLDIAGTERKLLAFYEKWQVAINNLKLQF